MKRDHKTFARFYCQFDSGVASTMKFKPNYVIISEARSGSTLLELSLSEFDNAVRFGECFNCRTRTIKRFTKIFGPVGDADTEQTYQIMQRRAGKRQWGFKNHSSTMYCTKAWWGLGEPEENVYVGWHLMLDPETKVIALSRENILEQFVSFLVAHKRKQWGSKNKEAIKRPDIQVVVDEQRLLEWFARHTNYRNWVKRDFPDALQLTYEGYTQHPHESIKQAQEFVGLEGQRHTNQLAQVKLNDRPMSKVIHNYEEIKALLTGTTWEWMLEE